MDKDYIIFVEGAYRVAQTRVSLDSVAYAFLSGQSPEGIGDSFPALTLEQVYGAITYYLAHQTEIDEYLRQGEADFSVLRQHLKERNSLLHQKLVALKQQKRRGEPVSETAQP